MPTVKEPARSPAEARRRFPAALEGVYLSVCDRGILADDTAAAVVAHVEAMQHAMAVRNDHEAVVARARERFGRLIGAAAEDVAFVRNVSDGVNSIANALPWNSGDNVVLTAELEHPNNIYPWLRLRSRGVELREVAASAGAMDEAAILEAVDDWTRVVACASVTFSPGLRTDLARIGRVCRERGVLFLVDAVQSCGILRHEVEDEGIDVLATSTSKGLLGLYGAGFLYVRREWAERLAPVYLSRTGADVAPDRQSEMGTAAFRPGAGRFELGSHNFPGAYAADASLQMLEAVGSEAIEAHVLSLAGSLAHGFRDLGLPVTEAEPARRSHIVTVGRLGDGGHAVTQDPMLQAWSERLREHGVVHTIRRGQLRFAFHLYNDESDVERLLAWTGAFFREAGSRRSLG